MKNLNIIPKKCYGQNFLFNTNILEKMSDLCCNNIVEIGPGSGYLTKYLINKCNTVHSIEIDPQFSDILNTLQASNENFTWTLQDALMVDWYQYHNADTIVGNLPYNISTKLILNMCKAKIKRCVFIVQEEVAQRINAKISTKDYSSLSVLIQAFYDVKLHCIISPGNFSPAPKVKSRLIELNIKNITNSINYNILSTITRIAFMHRRKALGTYFLKQYPEFIDLIDKQLRAENLSVDTYKQLMYIKQQ